MNINEIILNETLVTNYSNSYPKDLMYEYDVNRNEIQHFLLQYNSFPERQTEAVNIIDNIMVFNGKRELRNSVSELARIEQGIKELEPCVRDHVVHALLSFVLGIYINELFTATKNYVNPFQWKIAGLFHDIGYPIQIAQDIAKPFAKKINDIKRAHGDTRPDIRCSIRLEGIEELNNGINSLGLIQKCINNWRLNISAEREYQKSIQNGNTCHGMISALSILYCIDVMYQEFNPKRLFENIYDNKYFANWNQTFFVNDVVPACAAIFIHNLPKECFSTSKIDRSVAPVAFLLKLTDCLQDWERPSTDNPSGFSADSYEIKIIDRKLYLSIDPREKRSQKIKEEIESCLIAPDIEIQ